MAKSITKARVLWIAADPVFGGSRSQVQFPAELRGFFGLPDSPTIGDSVSRAVICAGVSFPAKKMDFHHNDVWRLNLPTAKQGLGGYSGKMLVFQKTASPSEFLLWLVDPGTPVARELRRSARRTGRFGSKRRDDGTRRHFGWF